MSWHVAFKLFLKLRDDWNGEQAKIHMEICIKQLLIPFKIQYSCLENPMDGGAW